MERIPPTKKEAVIMKVERSMILAVRQAVQWAVGHGALAAGVVV